MQCGEEVRLWQISAVYSRSLNDFLVREWPCRSSDDFHNGACGAEARVVFARVKGAIIGKPLRVLIVDGRRTIGNTRKSDRASCEGTERETGQQEVAPAVRQYSICSVIRSGGFKLRVFMFLFSSAFLLPLLSDDEEAASAMRCEVASMAATEAVRVTKSLAASAGQRPS